MTVTKLRTALSVALEHRRVTTHDVKAIEQAVTDGRGVSSTEAAALRAFLNRHHDRFDSAATTAMNALLESAPPPPPPQHDSTPAVVDWATFSVPSSREQVTGSQRNEGLATFDELAAQVSSGVLGEADQLLLAAATARVGIMGEAQATRAVARLAALDPAERSAFGQLADHAESPLERAFLYKALGAGSTPAEITAFAETIHGWPNERLLTELSLSDAITSDGQQTGLIQQFNGSCVVTTAQLLRGEVDPVYALEVRRQNPKLHSVDEHDPFKWNPSLAKEQGAQLDRAGGYPTPRIQGGVGVKHTVIDTLYNAHTDRSGFVYALSAIGDSPELTTDVLLDRLANQLERGIPTPVLVGDSISAKRHAMLALEVSGEGATQKFLMHDPWSGNTLEVSRQQFRDTSAPLGDFNRIGAIHVATPKPN